MLLREEIRRLAAWYTQEISQMTAKIEEVDNPVIVDREKRGELACLHSRKRFLQRELDRFTLQQVNYI